MKIAIAQINTTVGDIAGNTQLVIKSIEKAKSQSADILIMPELTLTGYPLQDLAYDFSYLKLQQGALDEITAASEDIIVCVGLIDYDEYTADHDRSFVRYNAIVVIQNKKIINIVYKTLLPNYDVFNERRYFKPSQLIEPVKVTIAGKEVKLGLEICEDLWDDFYEEKVSKILVEKGAELLINMSASPFEVDKLQDRETRVQRYAKELKVPFIYCNLVGLQDDVIFDGSSFAFNRTGEQIAQLSHFSEDFQVIDLDQINPIKVQTTSKIEMIYQALVFSIRDYFRKNQFEKTIIGLSGGIDSALVAILAQQALGSDKILGVAMPSKFSSQHSIEDAEALAKNLKIQFKNIPISDIHKTYEEHFKDIFTGQDISIADENIQARIRANILMAHSNQEGYILLSTSNKTELALGYSTLYGDMSGAVAVIGDLSKTRVYELALYINQQAGTELIPQNTIDKEPSAELRPDQVDPFNYDEVSPLIDLIIEGRKSIEDLRLMDYDEELLQDIFNKIRSNEFKRFQAPIIFKVTSKAFGPGRIYPKMNRYKNEG